MAILHTPDFSLEEREVMPWLGYAMTAAILIVGVGVFWTGIVSLGDAWIRPEYSHGPLIPLLSLFLFLRQMRSQDRIEDPVPGRWPGFLVMVLATGFAVVGTLARIPDIVTYGLVIWIYGVVLASMGWRHGPKFWPPVLHLAFMLPLPAILYWQLSIELQFISSELGVALIRAAGVPVFLDGNIIDLGVYKLHVAEACSGLRYLFPVLSFSYIFAVLFQGPVWIKTVLLLSAAPITIAMNAFRIGVIGVLVDRFGISQAEGFLHVFEGWVIFIACILILFGMARAMQRLSGDRRTLAEALDLSFEGLGIEAARVRRVRASVPMLGGIVLAGGVALALHAGQAREVSEIQRTPLALFPQQIADWQAGPRQTLEPRIETVLGADDYHSASFRTPEAAAPVDLFIAWYRRQTDGTGIHSPEVCLPAGGWEMSGITEVDLSVRLPDGAVTVFPANRAIIQHGIAKKLVFYWFEQRGRRMTSDYAAKAVTVLDGMMLGRTDGGLVRVITDILPGESQAEAEARLRAFLSGAVGVLPKFVPG